MAYDPDRGDLVMFGGAGASGQPLDDTWLWDGSSWSEAAPPHSPPGRFQAQMAWDPKSHLLILVGGTGGSGCSSEGPSIGSSGSAVPPSAASVTSTSVSASAPQSASAEPAAGCTTLQDAWAWDGDDWSQLSLGQGSTELGSYSLAGAEMATDPGSGQLVLLTSAYPLRGAPVPAPPEPAVGTGGSSSASPGEAGGAGAAIAPAGGGMTACPMIPAEGSGSPAPSACSICSCLPLPCREAQGGESPEAACPICPPIAFGGSSSGSPGASPAASAGATTGGSAQIGCCVSWSQSLCPPTCGDDLCVPEATTLTWVFDGSAFHPVSSSAGQVPPMSGHLAWFPSIGRLVELGWNVEPMMGTAAEPDLACPVDVPCPAFTAAVWEWDGSAWASVSVPPGRSSPLFAAAPVAETSAGRVLALDLSGATWLANDPAQGWTRVAPAHSPAPRGGTAMAFDDAAGQVVLFGGTVSAEGAGGQVSDDTWTWDGHDWTQRGGTAPSASPSPSGSAVPLPASAGSAPASTGGATPAASGGAESWSGGTGAIAS